MFARTHMLLPLIYMLLTLTAIYVPLPLSGQSTINQKVHQETKPQNSTEQPKLLTKIDYDKNTSGKASWYGNPFHGRLTANGEIYNMHHLTAAHKTLPFDSIVKVTNMNNGQTVMVRINDRGPYIKGRHIDLSYEAAKHINMLGKGVVPVKLEIMTTKRKFHYQERFGLLSQNQNKASPTL